VWHVAAHGVRAARLARSEPAHKGGLGGGPLIQLKRPFTSPWRVQASSGRKLSGSGWRWYLVRAKLPLSQQVFHRLHRQYVTPRGVEGGQHQHACPLRTVRECPRFIILP
jgi:hypothetical protein